MPKQLRCTGTVEQTPTAYDIHTQLQCLLTLKGLYEWLIEQPVYH